MTRWLVIILTMTPFAGACNLESPGLSGLRSSGGRGGGAGSTDGGVTAQSTSAPSSIMQPILPIDGLETLLPPAAAHEELCTADELHTAFPDDADMITRSFCQDKKPGGVMPTPKELLDLQKQLGLDFKDPNGGNGVGGNPAFAVLAHSSALTARRVSTITPTTFVFTPPPPDGSKPTGQYSVLAFDPGEQFVEVASYDPTAMKMNFYVVFFDKDCTKAGCSNGDLLTNTLTTGWSNVRVYEDTTALNNTIFDCHVCHQPKDSGEPFLRMQEIAAPFTHWMSPQTEGGRALLADFHEAHPTEDYGGIPATLLDKSDPSKLAALVTQAGAGAQPNAFPSAIIEAELKASAPGQPVVNDPPGTSATWQSLYDKAAEGLFIAPPYHDVKATDPTKLAAMTNAYKSWSPGGADLPEIRDVFLDTALRDMGFAPKAGLSGRGLLVQMCQECHNANLDPTVSRDLFRTDELAKMTREERDLAIMRLNVQQTSRLTMPPPLFHTITDAERTQMIDELKKDPSAP